MNIWRYCTALAKKGLIEKDGQAWKKKGATTEAVNRAKIDELSRTGFFALPIMQPMIEHAKTTKRGKAELTAFYGICKGKFCSFKCSPDAWIHDDKTHQYTVSEFRKTYFAEKGTDRIPGHLRRAIRMFYQTVLKIALPEAQAKNFGIDGAKDNIGHNAAVKMSDEQFDALTDYFEAQGNEELTALSAFHPETFGRPNAVFDALLKNFHVEKRKVVKATLEGFEPVYDPKIVMMLRLVGGDKVKVEQHDNEILVGQMYESKTNKLWTKFILHPRRVKIVKAWMDKRAKEGYKTFFGNDGETFKAFGARINVELKKAYRAIGLTDDYFFERPSYALRHCGAHLWLRRTGYNYGAVASMGWEDLSTLRTWYGAFDMGQLEQHLTRDW